MLSKKEKEEFIKDGKSKKRREYFKRAKILSAKRRHYSLDEYIEFLNSIQRVFRIPLRQDKKTVYSFNKL